MTDREGNKEMNLFYCYRFQKYKDIGKVHTLFWLVYYLAQHCLFLCVCEIGVSGFYINENYIIHFNSNVFICLGLY